jgi:DNA-binding transcriptional LysR family regulator
VGIASIAALPDTLEQFPFRDDLLVVVVLRGDPLGQRRRLALADMVDAGFVSLPRDSALQRHIIGHATRLGATLNVRARVTSFEAVCRMVEAGVGLGIVPEASARRCGRGMSIEIIRLSDPWAKRRLAICVNRLGALPVPAQRLVDHLRTASVLWTFWLR